MRLPSFAIVLVVPLVSLFGCDTAEDPDIFGTFDGGANHEGGTSNLGEDSGIIVVGGDTGTATTPPPDDSGTPADDTGTSSGSDSGSTGTDTGTTGGGSEQVTFPIGTDTYFGSTLPDLESAGDYIEGDRTLSLPSVSSIDGDWNIDNEVFGTTIRFDIYLNGTRVGSGRVGASDSNDITVSASFPPVTGPDYTIRFILTSDGDCGFFSGCDYVGVITDTSTFTFTQ